MKDSEELRTYMLLQAAAVLYSKTHNVGDATRVAMELEEEIKKQTSQD